MLHVVGVVEESSLCDVEIPDRLNRRIEAHHGKGKGAVIVLHRGILLQHADDVAAERNIVAQKFDIVIGEADLNAGLVASCLLRGAAGEDSDGGCAKALEDGLNGFAEAVAVGEEQHDSGDTPGHSRHGEQGTAQVMAHGGVGLFEQVAVHGYSLRRASTGSSRAARRAG